MIRQHARIFAIAIGIAVILMLSSIAGFFRIQSEQLTDALFTKESATGEIVIVEISDESIRNIGQWPWPRAVFGRLIDRLQKASVVGIDVNFKEPSRLGNADDLSFAQSLQNSDAPVILTAEMREDGSLILPISPLREHSSQGFPNLVIAPDGVARVIRYTRSQQPSFALRIAQTYQQKAGQDTSLFIPQFSTRIRYLGPDKTFTLIPANEVINGIIPDSFFENKIILIGATARDLQDFHETPFGITSGVEIQANIITTLLNQKFYRTYQPLTLLSILFFALLTAWLVIKVKKLHYLAGILGGVFILYNLSAFVAFDNFIIADLFYPNVAIVLTAGAGIAYQYFATAREKKFIQETFSRYLAPQVIHELIRDPSKLSLGGKKENLTILFSDVRGFTTLSESMTPEQLTAFLNRYLSRMTNLILEYNGVIDKYIGDAIMAFWGAPLPEPKHTIYGVVAALRMVSELKTFNEESAQKGDPLIDIGIGINSGDVTIGNMGSERRFDYTVMGDNVNLASRLEGLTKVYGVNILVSQATVDAVRQQNQRRHEKVPPPGIKRTYRLIFRELDQVQVKGKTKGVKIYEVIPSFRQEAAKTLLLSFDQARERYYAGRWQEAVNSFEKILAEYPDDKPSLALRERCLEFIKNPPEKWEGVYQLTHK